MHVSRFCSSYNSRHNHSRKYNHIYHDNHDDHFDHSNGFECNDDCAHNNDDYHDGNLAWRPVSGLPAPKAGNAEDADPDATEQPEPAVYENGRVYARLGRHILRLRGAKATLLADDIPPEVSFVQMDSSFRLLGLSTEGQLVRWSKRRGLRALRGQPVGH